MSWKSHIFNQSKEFKETQQFHKKNLEELQCKIEKNAQGGGPAAQKKQKERGKMTARERIEALIDPGTEFLELSPLAALDVYQDPVPGAGLVTGIGSVHGRLCMIVANDQTVKGGTYYPLTVKKHLRAQEIAEKNHLPCLYLVDSGGAFLPLQDEIFPDKDDFGRIFFNQARMSAKKIPQLAVVHGFCTAGGAYIPAMSDQTVIVKDTGTIFLAGPPLVKAATGEDVTANDLGGAVVHTQISGVADHFAQNDAHGIQILREIVSCLSPMKCGIGAGRIKLSEDPAPEPCYSQEELLGIIPKDFSQFVDIREIMARLLDGSNWLEFKKDYGPTLVTAFAQIGGIPVGVIGNNGVLFSECALKATHFIEICCQEERPLLFLQNITGFMVGKKYEHEGIAKHGAKMVHAVANAGVPKVTLIVGGSFGAGNYGMCGRAYDPDFLFMWPQGKIAVMGGEQAAQVLVHVKKQATKTSTAIGLTEEQEQELKNEILQEYQKKSSAYYSSSQIWDDGILDPRKTRKTLIQAFQATLNRPNWTTTTGIFRM